jgi:ribosomal protein L3 glutamine methyltransferase
MFAGHEDSLISDPYAVETILDLCTGSACLAILAAMRFENAHVCASDLSKEALEVAKINVEKHRLQARITLFQGDLFAPLGARKFDLVLANPPYVADAEAKAFDAEYRAEPLMAHVSGPDGLDITRRILTQAPKHLADDGLLICEIGTGRDLLAEEFPDLAFRWLDTEFSEGEVFALTKTDFDRI